MYNIGIDIGIGKICPTSIGYRKYRQKLVSVHLYNEASRLGTCGNDVNGGDFVTDGLDGGLGEYGHID